MSLSCSELGFYSNISKLTTSQYSLMKCYEDKKHLIKLKLPKPKEKGLIYHTNNVELQGEGQLYIKNKDLLKKVNPVAYKIEKNKEIMDIMFLKKKLEKMSIKENKEIKLS